MSPIRSMTGFARARRSQAGCEVVAGLKSVNHRGLDLHFHIPPELDSVENALRDAIKQRVARGHLDVRIGLERGAGAPGLAVNRGLLAAYLASFRQAAEEFGVSGEPDLNAAFRIPGMFGLGEEDAGPELAQLALETVVEALDTLNRFREREGAQLAGLIRAHSRRIAECAGEIEQLRVHALPAFQARLAERIAELLAGAALDPQRLAQEAALLVDRSDIGEEVSRLKIHSGQVDALVDAGGEIGKKLDFLLQEMNRETNTILSKTGGAGELGLRITELALAAKAEIEKIREQALNLE